MKQIMHVKTCKTSFNVIIFFPNLTHQSQLLTKFYAAAAAAKSLQSCPTLCDPIDGSPLGSSVPGFLHARILEWVAISFSKFYATKNKIYNV